MKFEPVQHEPSCVPFFRDVVEANSWEPQCSHPCAFDPASFLDKMMNLVLNPNLNSTWLFRADILYDSGSGGDDNARGEVDKQGVDGRTGLAQGSCGNDDNEEKQPFGNSKSALAVVTHDVRGMRRYRTLVRRLIPRNEKRDRPLDQTCSFYRSYDHLAEAAGDSPESPGDANGHGHREQSTLIIYSPHAEHGDIPFYHPKVRGIAHFHQWNPSSRTGTISIHFLPFVPSPTTIPTTMTPEEALKLRRTAYHLLETIHKHGHAQDYVKRVHHDVVVPRRRFQDRYAALKTKYARSLVESWAEKTDPTKHVFEDLGIAAFLIELWADMYPSSTAPNSTNSDSSTKRENSSSSSSNGEKHKDAGVVQKGGFPGFEDMACGNGLLVYILNQEGFTGWGFDVRRRKSWAQYSPDPSSHQPSPPPLQERLLLPDLILSTFSPDQQSQLLSPLSSNDQPTLSLHGGRFPPGTFIISNHGDELTPWTPILASLSRCPFIVIPCCSHNLAGERFRAPPPRDRAKSKSAYASLVDWVTRIAEDCGWFVETEMLRIPSTRNTCMLGRTGRASGDGGSDDGEDKEGMDDAEALSIVDKYGGVRGYFEAVSRLVKSEARGH